MHNKYILIALNQLGRHYPGFELSAYNIYLIMHSNGNFSEFHECTLFFDGYVIHSKERSLREMCDNLKVKLQEKFSVYTEQAA
ncbi:hypothetical protein [Adhaeribacter aquaticus]|uniref:hypothetical protein n=1 Tax=Adhaeribacter aquaticus TaxID=299567 RepID=UPI000478E654|nr:hypothetical protein [Adhaeribacter aquaticus]